MIHGKKRLSNSLFSNADKTERNSGNRLISRFDLQRSQQRFVIGSGNITRFKITYNHTAIMHNVIDFRKRGNRYKPKQFLIRRVGHMEPTARTLPRIEETVTEQITDSHDPKPR